MLDTKQAQRTRKDIINAFTTLLLEKNLNEINITDVCERAMITRATFYKYFEDKHHLLSSILEDYKQQIVEKGLKDFSYNSPKELYLKVVSLCFEFIEMHETGFKLFIKHGFNNQFHSVLLETINDAIEEILKEESGKFKYKIPISVLSKFITGGFAYSATFLMENKHQYTKEQILSWLDQILNEFFI